MLPRIRCRDHRGHHPWRFLGLFLPEWRVVFVDYIPGGRKGHTIHELRIILILNGLTVAQRRCTLCHEIGHVLRGPFRASAELYEEALVDRQAARLLLPSVRKIAHAMAFHRGDYGLTADELWVDEALLNVKLSTLAPRDKAWLGDQMASILL